MSNLKQGKMKKLIEWVEIPTTDFKRALNFYNEVFNISMAEIDCGTEKMACFPTGEGAIFYQPDYKPSGRGVIVSLNVPESIEQTAVCIEKNGGKMIIPKTKIEAEGRGYFALFVDTEGNRIGLYEKL